MTPMDVVKSEHQQQNAILQKVVNDNNGGCSLAVTLVAGLRISAGASARGSG